MGSCVQNRPVSSSALKINELYTACNRGFSSVWAEPQTARLKSCFRMGTAANAAGTPSVWNVNYTFINALTNPVASIYAAKSGVRRD